MNKNHLIILITVTLILAAVATTFVGQKEEKKQSSTPSSYHLPELRSNINNITHITVQDNSASTSLELKDGVWVTKNKHDYPADFSKIRRLLIDLSELKTIESKTAKKEKYHLLGVQAPEDQGTTSKLVKLGNQDNSYELSLIIGNSKFSGKPGLYVRKLEEELSWLVEGRVNITTQTKDWLSKQVLDISADRIDHITITQPNDDVVSISKDSEDSVKFVLANKPDGKELSNESNLATIAGSLSNLMLDDVIPLSDFDFGTNETTHTRFELTDGLAINIKLAKKENNTYAHISAEAISDTNTATDDKSSQEKTPTSIAASADSEVNAINAKHQNWVYVIPSFKASNLIKKMEELVQYPQDEGNIE